MIAIEFISFQGYGHRFIGWLPDRMNSADRVNLWAADIIWNSLICWMGPSNPYTFENATHIPVFKHFEAFTKLMTETVVPGTCLID